MAGSIVCICKYEFMGTMYSIKPDYIYFFCFGILFRIAYFSWISISFYFFPTFVYIQSICRGCCRGLGDKTVVVVVAATQRPQRQQLVGSPSGAAAVPEPGNQAPAFDWHFVFQSLERLYIHIYNNIYMYMHGHNLNCTSASTHTLYMATCWVTLAVARRHCPTLRMDGTQSFVLFGFVDRHAGFM